MMQNIELVKVDDKNLNSQQEVDEVLKFLRNTPCQLLKFGFRQIETKFYFCSCDPDMKEPICGDCKDRCHKDHTIIKSMEMTSLCTCGLKCHNIKDTNQNINQNYITKCFFNEFSEISKNNIFYENKNISDIICQFCFNFCQENDSNFELTKKSNSQCNCDHNNHKEFKSIHNKIKLLSSKLFYEMNFENLTHTHLLNLILMSNKTFDNLYVPLLQGLKLITNNINVINYNFEEFHSSTSDVNVSLESFTKLAISCKRMIYFYNNDKINFSQIFNSKMIFQFLERKFDYKIIPIWNLKTNLMALFLKFQFKREFNHLPNFKIFDIELMNPFQRLITVKLTQNLNCGINNQNFKFLDNFLQILSKLLKINEKLPETFSLIYRVYQVCKFYAKFSLFTHEQLQKFSQINDDLIFNFSESIKLQNDKNRKENLISEHFKILSPMIKSIRYLIFHYNDQILFSYLKNEILIEKLNFYHMSDEICKNLTKNAINIMTYLRYFKKKESEIDKDYEVYKIMSQATKVIAMNMNNPDYYQVGIERLFDRNKEICLKYLQNNFDSKEKIFIEFLNSSVIILEKLYQSYFEFKIMKNEITNSVIQNIKDFFDQIGIQNYQPKFNKYENSREIIEINKDGEKKRVMRRKTDNELKIGLENNNILYNHKFKILMNNSFFIYSIVKLIKIFDLENKNTNEIFSIDEILFNQIYKLISFYVENNSDNCIILLTSDFDKIFTCLNNEQLDKMTELLEYIILQLMQEEFEFSSNYTILKLIEIISKKSRNSNENLKTLERVINIIKLVTKIRFINHEHTYESLRKIMKEIYEDNPQFVELKNYLINKNKKIKINNLLDNTLLIEREKGISEVLVDGFNLVELMNTFIKFLNILTYLFDGDATLNEIDFLQSIISPEDSIKILITKDLNLLLRTEILKFYRIVYIDVIINSDKINLYRNLIINPPKIYNEEENMESKETFKLYEELININQSDIDFLLKLDSTIIKNELKNFKEFIQIGSKNNNENIIEYFEQGIILPMMVHLNKFMSVLYTLDMEEYLKLYEIVFYFLKLKEYVITNHKTLFENSESTTKIKNVFKNKISNNQKRGLIKNSYEDNQLNLVIKDLEIMNNTNFEILNFNNIYRIFENHLNSFIIKPGQISLKKSFQKSDFVYSENQILKKKNFLLQINLLKTEYEKKIFDMIIKYSNDKNKLDDSTFIQTLEEDNSYYSMRYRSLLIRSLLFLISDIKSAERYRRISLWGLLKLLQFDTSMTQKSFYELFEQNSDLLNLNDLIDLFFNNFVSILFTLCNPSQATMNYDYFTAMTIIKILKYLCEEHNEKFQKIFFQEIKLDYIKENENENEKIMKISGNVNSHINLNQKISLFDFMLTILGKIIFLSEWEKTDFNTDEKNISYYYDIFFVIIEFLIEMVQGTEKSNLISILNNINEEEAKHFSQFLNQAKTILFKDKNDSKILTKLRKDIMDFLMAFLEEKSTPIKLVTIMANILHPNNCIESIQNVMKKLYLKTNKIIDKTFEEIKFDLEMCEYFSDKYFEDVKFCENEEFQLANRMYQYIKLLATEKYAQEDSINIINSVKNHSIEKIKMSLELMNQKTNVSNNEFLANSDMVFDDNFYENYFCTRFFEKITRTVLVNLENNLDEENNLVRVIFTLNPLTKYLSKHTKDDFSDRVNRDGRYIKLYSLIEQSEFFYDEIKYSQSRENLILNFINKFNYYWFEVFSFFITLTINIYMIVILDHKEIEVGDANNLSAITTIEYFNLVFNILMILIWCYSKLQLYYIQERKKYLFSRQLEELSKWDSIVVLYNAIIMRNKINTFIWNTVFSAFGVAKPGNNFVYSVQLFSIINLSETLRNILRSVTEKFKQVLATMMLMFIVCYVFASIAFFYFSEFFVFNIFDPVVNNNLIFY